MFRQQQYHGEFEIAGAALRLIRPTQSIYQQPCLQENK
jgi:hypothetical protein